MLADEYGRSDKWDPAFGEPREPNVTTNSDPKSVKWSSLITNSSDPIVPCNAKVNPYKKDTIALFEGAKGYDCGVFRPAWDCKMRHHKQQFCAVCQKTIKDALNRYLHPTAD